MNEIEALDHRIRKLLPDAKTQLDRPDKSQPRGTWWLDIARKGRSAAVEWRPGAGFGLSSTPTGGFGEGSDEVYDAIEDVAGRIVRLLRTGERTHPPEMALAKLRRSLHKSQQALGKRLGVRQAAISKLERRSDMFISTLGRFIAAMGGTLEIRARFPEGVVRISQFGDFEGK